MTKSPARFRDQVAVVTGGASGIGRAVCARLQAEGARVGLIDRDEEKLRAVAEELSTPTRGPVVATADVAERGACAEAMGELRRRLGSVDILVASAGITDVTLLETLAVDRTERLLEVNLLGVAEAVEAVIPDMVRRGRGRIAGISSLVAVRGLPFTAAYCASKAAVAVYLQGLRSTLRRQGVTVTVVYPGYVRTPLTEAGAVQPPIEMMTPEAAAGHIVNAIHRRRPVCRFPRGLSGVFRVLRWLPPALYDGLMTRAAAEIKHLQY